MGYNNDDWELIRREMETEAVEREFERLQNKHANLNNMFLRMFPKHMRNKVLDIEEGIMLTLLFVGFIVISVLIWKH